MIYRATSLSCNLCKLSAS